MSLKDITTNKQRIGMLRQWINEDVKSKKHKLVTNEEILFWLTGDESYLVEQKSHLTKLTQLSQEYGMYMNTSKVTRVEVIDHTKAIDHGGGRAYMYYHVPSMPEVKVEVMLQDGGRTLKVFIENKK